MLKFGVEVFEEMSAGDGNTDLLSHPSMAWHFFSVNMMEPAR